MYWEWVLEVVKGNFEFVCENGHPLFFLDIFFYFTLRQQLTTKLEKCQGKCLDVNESQNVLQIAQGPPKTSPLPLFPSPKTRAINPPDSFLDRRKKNPFSKLLSKLQVSKTCQIILNLLSSGHGI